jgi:hypothetical protein
MNICKIEPEAMFCVYLIGNKNKIAMKNILFSLSIILLLAACNAQKRTAHVIINNGEPEVSDSIEYGLIILDPGFETWFLTQARPMWYHSQSYLESWNRQYVSAWNSRAMSGRTSRYFETYIDYQPHIDYGLELNYKLFYYFQYVEKRLKIPILPSGMGPQSL